MSHPTTTVIGSRVPAQVATELRHYANAHETTSSKIIANAVTKLLATTKEAA